MENLKIKKKIYNFKTLEIRLIKRKLTVSPFVQVRPNYKKKSNSKKLKKDNKISTAVRLLSACHY